MPSRANSKANLNAVEPVPEPSIDHENLQVQELKNQVGLYHHQLEHAQRTIMQYEMRMQALMNELNSTKMQATEYTGNQDNVIRSLQEQINVWKSKYEAMAKMYQGLRNEHLELLKKYQEALKNAGSKEALAKLQDDLKAKTAAYNTLLSEKNQLKAEFDRAKESHLEEIARLRRDVAENKARVTEMAQSKGSEYDNLVKKFNMEKSLLEDLNMVITSIITLSSLIVENSKNSRNWRK
jgi:chromosome segregation ATPase